MIHRLMLALFFVGLTPLESFCAEAPPQTTKQHAFAMHGNPKYPAGFKHFDYANPNAPKGGDITIGAVGTFNSINAYVLHSISAAGTGILGPNLLFEQLMRPAEDEPESFYGLIAESIEMPDDRSWIIFNINPKARWADGEEITAEDVAFSLKLLRDEGRAFMRSYYKKVERVEVLSKYRVKYTLKPKVDDQGNKVYERDLPTLLARMTVFPKHFLKGKDFSKLTQAEIVGSGPYKIKHLDMGRSITYERRPDHWAKDLNVNVGTWNFDTIRYDYYRTTTVAFEAFKAGAFDFLIEADPRRWGTSYGFSAVDKGQIKRLELPHTRPVGMRALVFNTRKPLFKDTLTRQALSYAFDFKWLNENIFSSAFKRTRSYFENTDLASQGLPSSAELKLLEPLRGTIPEEVFTKAYAPTCTSKTPLRQGLRQAKALLKQAGWVMKKGKLLDPKTGKPLIFEILLTLPEEEKIALAFARNLKTLGVTLRISTVDSAEYWTRVARFDFDMIHFQWSGSKTPSGGVLAGRWGTQSFERSGSLNYMGANDPAIDILSEHVNQARTREELQTALRALDRVLLWGHYVIPLFHDHKTRVAHWDKFEYLTHDPEVGITYIQWWSKDAEKHKA